MLRQYKLRLAEQQLSGCGNVTLQAAACGGGDCMWRWQTFMQTIMVCELLGKYLSKNRILCRLRML
jgi:hypothetical protein